MSSHPSPRVTSASLQPARDEEPYGELDPQVAALFQLLKARGMPREPEALRSMDSLTALGLASYACAVASQQTIHVPGPRGPVRAVVYQPGPPESGPYPVLVYFHGGGYVFGGPESYAHLTTQICMDARAVVVSVDYRLAPEHPYPQPLEDCLACVRWLRQHAQLLQGDPERIGFVGDSAGGNAAVCVALLLRDAGEPAPASLALLCPWLDMTLTSESYQRFAPHDPMMGEGGMLLLLSSYLRGHPATDPRVSPVLAELHGLPESLIVVGEIDPLYSDGVTFARKLQQHGGTAHLRSYRGMPHNFACLPFIDVAKESRGEVQRFHERVLAKRGEPLSASPARR